MNNHYYQLGNNKELYNLLNYLNFNIGNTTKYLFRAGTKENEPYQKDIKKAIDYVNYELEFIESNYFVAPTNCVAYLHKKEISDMFFIALQKIENKYSKLAFKFLYEYIMYHRKSSLVTLQQIIKRIEIKDYMYLDNYNFYFLQEPLK